MPRAFILSVVLFSLLVSCGCNVGPLFRDRQAPRAARVSDAELAGIEREAGRTADDNEMDLVEAVVSHRADYHRSLVRLREFYKRHGYIEKQRWAEYELKGFRRIKQYRYSIDAEVGPENLQATESIPQADDLYDRGMGLMRRGGYGLPGVYNRNLMVDASRVFKELIDRYPSSDKIDDAAYHLGEIHSKYLPNEEAIAVEWYRRAWTWDPKTPHPARFRAADVYDHRLRDRAMALELYHSVVEERPVGDRYANAAARRIRELSAER